MEKRIPAYIKLYLKIREEIMAGLYPYGAKLPSKRILAEENGVSTVTAEHCYDLLIEEGYVEARERSGYFIAFRMGDGFLSPPSNASLPKPHKSTRSEEEEFPFSVLTRTMRAVISDLGEGILERSPGIGLAELRSSIKSYLARSRGITVSEEQIVVGSGSEQLYKLIVDLLGRDRTYAIESPSYNKIEEVYRASGVSYASLPLGNDGIKSSALRDSTAGVLHVTPYRSFPSGVTASASKRHEYLRWAKNGDRYIVEDDFESEFSVSSKPEETLFSHSRLDNVIYVNTFSKTLSPSLRVGYMVLPKHLAREFNERLSYHSCTVPTYVQHVIARLLNSGDFERHVNRVRRSKRKSMK